MGAFSYDELDALLRGRGGKNGTVGMSAIDGLIAALVTGPSFVPPQEWLPAIFNGKLPNPTEGSVELRAIQTIFARYNDVSETLSQNPRAYQPIFMIDDDGSFYVRDWAASFMRGIAFRSDDWAMHILMTKNRTLLTPILVYVEPPTPDFLPEISAAEKLRLRKTAHLDIAKAVAAVREICNPYRAMEETPRPRRRRKR